MLDVHPPHHSPNTWRDFALHIATIVVGLLIAIGLEQTVELLHRRHQVAETRTALDIERRVNVNRFAAETGEFHRLVPILQTDLAVFQYLKKHPGAPAAQWPGELRWHFFTLGFSHTAWSTAQQSTVLQHMPLTEIHQLGELYARLDNLNQLILEERLALIKVRQFAIQEPDASKLSPAQIDRQLDLSSDVLLAVAQVANAQRNLSARFTDFTPAPNRADYYQIVHIETPPQDLNDVSTALKQVDNFERSLGVAPEDSALGGAPTTQPNPH